MGHNATPKALRRQIVSGGPVLNELATYGALGDKAAKREKDGIQDRS
jgi:hypothetical protein